VRRATTGGYLGAMGFSAELVAEVDLLRFELTEAGADVRRFGALYLASRGGAQWVAEVSPPMLSASLGVGWRLY
jgi:hypothetical protein